VNGQTRVNGTMNGTKLSVPVLGDWQPVHLGGMTEPEPAPVGVETAPIFPDAVAEAEAAAIRARSQAEAEAARIRAEAEADAIRARAAEEARKLRLANDKAEQAARERNAASEARIAEANRRRQEAERAAEQTRAADDAQQAVEAEHAKEVAAADAKWRSYAIGFAIVCGIVSLPVQMSFFWNPKAPWMAAAPLMLEGAAWVVHRGARAAVANRRPVWHYRTIVWLLALLAAGVNFYHGMHSFDTGTAVATAFASIAGPGVWDLHENGRIRRCDGVLTRRERKAQEKAEAAVAKERAAREAVAKAEKEAAARAAREAAEKLAKEREESFPEVWKYALKLAAALGETTVTQAVWVRAHRDVEGTDPGDSPEAQRLRNRAARRMLDARADAPDKTVWKGTETATNAQRAIQVKGPRTGSAYKPVPPRRTKGDTAPFHPIAKALAADAKRQSNTAREDA
jgi:chemotaxis protein histidine kinase CheA